MATSLVLLSGGLDSATALAVAALDSTSCYGLFLSYGQAAAREEMEAAKAIADHYRVTLRTLTTIGPRFESGEIRGRNAFLIHSALLAAQQEPTTIIMGLHSG